MWTDCVFFCAYDFLLDEARQMHELLEYFRARRRFLSICFTVFPDRFVLVFDELVDVVEEVEDKRLGRPFARDHVLVVLGKVVLQKEQRFFHFVNRIFVLRNKVGNVV